MIKNYMIKKERSLMWIIYALASAFFAALTTILAKVGIEGVNSNLATAIRTVVVLLLAWGMVFLTGVQSEMDSIPKRSIIFLALSGIATGLSWLCYFKAVQIGEVAKVAAIDKFSIVFTILMAFFILNEMVATKVIVGAICITLGTLLMIL